LTIHSAKIGGLTFLQPQRAAAEPRRADDGFESTCPLPPADGSSGLFGLYEPIILCMGSDPDPQHPVFDFHRQGSMVQADACRPELPEFLEM
jgi:hypothetical protein